MSVKNSIQLYEKGILSEKFISIGEVRSIISLVINYFELKYILMNQGGGGYFLLGSGLDYKTRNLCTLEHT